MSAASIKEMFKNMQYILLRTSLCKAYYLVYTLVEHSVLLMTFPVLNDVVYYYIVYTSFHEILFNFLFLL